MKIGVISPGYAMKVNQLAVVVARLEQQGHTVVVHPQCYERHLAFAGTDDSRLAAFYDVINDPSFDVVMTTRAAHGVARIYNRLDASKINSQGGVFVGFSDQTGLCWFLSAVCKRRTIYGPILRQIYNQVTETEVDALFSAITEPQGYDFQKLVDAETVIISHGLAEGELVGGNLTMLQQLIGTRYPMDTKGRILFFEDLDESLHHIDRIFAHLRNAGILDGLAGVIIGKMPNCGSEDTDYGTDIAGVITENFGGRGYPVVMGAAFGHSTIHGPEADKHIPKIAIPYLQRVRLDATSTTIKISAAL